MKIIISYLFLLPLNIVNSYYYCNKIKQPSKLKPFISKQLKMMNDHYKEKQILRNKDLYMDENYNHLLNSIQKHETDSLYFTPRLDVVISEHKEMKKATYVGTGTEVEGGVDVESEEINGINLFRYRKTNIQPFITNQITDIAYKNNVNTVFLKEPVNSYPSIFSIFENLGGSIGYYIFFFIGLSVISNLLRSVSNSNNPFMSNNMKPLNKVDLINANITLNSFAGSDEILEECMEVVSYIRDSSIYKNIGAEVPKGILLEGPPGTGKTLLAKAIAAETNANFVSIAASEFVELYVGMGASKIRNLFKLARENKPCIIFIDEIDAVGKKRGNGMNGGNDEREQTLNQLLAEMDGFNNNKDILVIAATNRRDILDSALIRPGRFDRIIRVPLPDRISREAILQSYVEKMKIDTNISISLLSDLTSGFSGAQIKNLLNEAAINAVRNQQEYITQENILDGLDKMLVGIVKKTEKRDKETIRRVAIHEIGHTLLAATFKEYFDIKKVSIKSTYEGAGGYTIFSEYQNITDSGLYTKDLLFKRLIITYGGKAAEKLYYGEDLVSVGAIQDLKQANQLAQQIIGNYGMGKKLETFYNDNVENGMQLYGNNKYSELTKEVFDAETLKILNDAYEKAYQILDKNKEKMDKLVAILIKEKVLLGADIYKQL